jgi:uncharacterized protein YyaL (SSP411 family)
MKKQHVNSLIQESSPYLLQHAHNPVDWFPWRKDILEKAKDENRLLIISIGYATCHWCHVMEHESFEDPAVAAIMNRHFINIKVDREEHPDVDQVYMNAVQLMTKSGGWPLNVVALPDGRPVWGGTYFQKEHWKEALLQIQKLFEETPEKLLEYASKLEQGIKAINTIYIPETISEIEKVNLKEIVSNWSKSFDEHYGGIGRAPKFMMPGSLSFLWRFAYFQKDKKISSFVENTLTKMAYGGIFDHINGGFSRYSVDHKWHVPHFEKMGYDNAQLVSLYSEVFRVTQNEHYKEVVEETLSFVKNELTSPQGLFYTALDADSINEYGILEEGAYYVFLEKELKETLDEDFPIFAAYYNCNDFGKWEGKQVFIRTKTEDAIAKEFAISKAALQAKKKDWKHKLKTLQSHRSKPRLDHKILTSWNALMIKAYADAYLAFQKKEYLESAVNAAIKIKTHLLEKNGFLFHQFTENTPATDGFLEDYAQLTEAFIKLYEVTFEEEWLLLSKKICNYTLTHFFDEKTSMFYFTTQDQSTALGRVIDYHDNVIASSNSVMAKVLFHLGHYFDESHYIEVSKKMAQNIIPEAENFPSGFSNWLDLIQFFQIGITEIAIVGKNAKALTEAVQKIYYPNKILIANISDKSELPLLQHRFIKDKTVAYICKNKTCSLPLISITELLNTLKTFHL